MPGGGGSGCEGGVGGGSGVGGAIDGGAGSEGEEICSESLGSVRGGYIIKAPDKKSCVHVS